MDKNPLLNENEVKIGEDRRVVDQFKPKFPASAFSFEVNHFIDLHLNTQLKNVPCATHEKPIFSPFAKNDEVVSGLTEFAQKYTVKSAHYTGIGNALSAKVGWFDYRRNEFRVILIGHPKFRPWWVILPFLMANQWHIH